MIYQVTAMYEDAEVGYGESEVFEDAVREAAESVPEIYPADEVMLRSMCVEMPLSVWQRHSH